MPASRSRKRVLCGALAIGLLPLGAQAEPARFAQAGSVGGSVGQPNKTLTGDAEAPRPARTGFHYPVGLDPRGDNWLALRSEPNSRGYRIRKMGPDTLMTVTG